MANSAVRWSRPYLANADYQLFVSRAPAGSAGPVYLLQGH